MHSESARQYSPCRFLPVRINNPEILQSAYLPFLRNGGLLVSTTEPCAIGDQVFLLLRVLDEPERIAQLATVVWLNPEPQKAGKLKTVGVRFGDGDERLRGRLERYLAQDDHE